MFRRFLYLTFRFAYSSEHWIRRRFTKAGLLALVVLMASGAVGLDTNRTLAYQVFTFLLSLLFISITWSLFFRSRLAVRRVLPRFGTAGQTLSYRIIIQNQTNRSQNGLVLLENLVDPRPSFQEFIQSREPGEESRNWFDRTVGYPRWLWLVSKNRGAVVEEQLLSALSPNEEGELRSELLPLRRGHLRFTGVTVARPDPFGVFKAFITIPAEQSVLVLPKIYTLPGIKLPGTRKYQQGGVALASSIGEAEEFVSLRDYRPGDPLRRIHWKSWARMGKPVVKEYQDEFFVRHALVLDTFLDTDYSEVFEEAVSVAASFSCSIQTQESLLDLMFVGTEAYCFTAGRGLGHTDKMLEILACVRACKNKPFHMLHHLVIERYSSLSGCICVLQSWDEERQRFISQLDSLGIPTLVLVIMDSKTLHRLAPDPVSTSREGFHRLEVGKIAEGLAKL